MCKNGFFVVEPNRRQLLEIGRLLDARRREERAWQTVVTSPKRQIRELHNSVWLRPIASAETRQAGITPAPRMT